MSLTKNVSLCLIVLWAVNVVALPTNTTKTASSRNPNDSGPNPICVPTRWTDIASFFIGNYFAHAATVKLHPGESALSAIWVFVSALLLPTSGLIRGLNGVLRNASFRKRGFCKAISHGSDYQTAVAAGALCMVVRTKFWRPQTGDEILDVILRGKCSPPPDRKNAYNHVFEVELSSEEQEVTEKKLKVYSPPWAQEQGRFWGYTDTLSENVDPSRAINGSYDFKCQRRSYALAYVPRDAKVESAESPMRPVHLHALERGKEEEHAEEGITPATDLAIEEPSATPEPAPVDGLAVGPLCPNPDRPAQQIISASYNLPKALIAIIQLIYATTTLYQSRGNQVTIYGYAAFGLTVVPYAIMSFVNLVSALVTPDYPALFMVGSDIMDEAIRRGAKFDGVVGRLVLDPQPTTQKATPTATVLSASIDDVFVSEFLHECKEKESKFPVTIIDYPTPDKNTDGKDRELKTVDKAATDLSPSVFVPSCSKFRRADYKEFELDIYKTSMTVQGLFKFSVSPRRSTTRGGLSVAELSDLCLPNVSRRSRRGRLSAAELSDPRVTILLVVNGLVVFAIIGGLSQFNQGSSTNSQRSWTMTWYVFGMIAGAVPLERVFGRNDVGLVEKFVSLFLGVFLYGIPSIGGFVVVAQMMQAYGTC